MARVKRGIHGRKHHRSILEQATGYYGERSRTFKSANEAVMHAGQYAYRDRRAKKGDFRRLWIERINAAARIHGLSYSQFIAGMNRSGIMLNRKMLADIAITDESTFQKLVEIAKSTTD